MTATEHINDLIECRDVLEQGDPYDQYLAERVNDSIHSAYVDAWFTGELDESDAPDDAVDNEHPMRLR